MAKHQCYCGAEYECPWCDTREAYVCPTINDDEDGNMCDDCIADVADDMLEEDRKFYLEHCIQCGCDKKDGICPEGCEQFDESC